MTKNIRKDIDIPVNKNNYKIGKAIPTWNSGKAQSITFIVTEDCNLRCKYCYITHKSSNKKMDFETAKKFIDYLLDCNLDRQEAVIIEFIGGEPFIEIELVTQISDYFKIATFKKDDPWYWNYRINISTNGINYSDPDVQKFITKNLNKISIGMTIDGSKEKHDLQRVFPDQSGSYDIIKNNIPLYIKQVGGSTKVTFASDDLIYLKESIISLWNNGITHVAANVVFENVWKEEDDLILQQQLMHLADYIIENKLFNHYYCTFFNDSIGQYNNEKSLNSTFCGAGKMIALGPDGKLYPCIRYKDYSLNHNKEWIIGTVDDGIDMDKVRPFVTAMTRLQSDEECIECEIATGCAFCQGFNYDEAETPTNFSRVKYICKMHKARVRANNYYFSLLFNKFGIERENYEVAKQKRIYILLSDDHITYCQYSNNNKSSDKIDKNILKKALEYSQNEFFLPVLVHSETILDYYEDFESIRILHLVPAKYFSYAKLLRDYILVFDKTNYDLNIDHRIHKCILNIDAGDIILLSKVVIEIFNKTKHIDVNICSINKNFNELEYKEQLNTINDYLVYKYIEYNELKTINLITDLCYMTEHNSCTAGERSFTLAPNGQIYVCPAFYSSDINNFIGDLNSGLSRHKNKHLYKSNYRPICKLCDARQCVNCHYINVNTTNEVNVSPSFQCRKSHIEREISRQHQIKMGTIGNNIISEINYVDPIELFISSSDITKGYYNYKNQ